MNTPGLPTHEPATDLWQQRLHRSVRLYLALGEPGVEAVMVEARLRLVERHLVQHLLHGRPPTPSARAKAQHQVQLAQQTLLLSPAQVTAILQEWSAEQAIQPPQYSGQYTNGWLSERK